MIQQQNEKLPQQSQNFLLGKEMKIKIIINKWIMVAWLEIKTFCMRWGVKVTEMDKSTTKNGVY